MRIPSSAPRRLSAAPALLASTLLAGLLAACSSTDQGRRTMAGGPEPVDASIARALAPQSALAWLPGEAGPIVSVVESRRLDRTEQKITLAGDVGTDGDNEITVTSHHPRRYQNVPPVDEASLRDEMAERLPGVAMSLSPRVVVAQAGPVGFATGRAGSGAGCLYAWTSGDQRRPVTFARMFGVDGDTPDRVDVRVRVCRRGLDENRAVALVQGLQMRTGTAPVAYTDRAPVAYGPGGDALASAGLNGAPTAAPAYGAPVYGAPVYAAPAPTYGTPVYDVPVYAAPTAPAPVYAAPAAPPAPAPAATHPRHERAIATAPKAPAPSTYATSAPAIPTPSSVAAPTYATPPAPAVAPTPIRAAEAATPATSRVAEGSTGAPVRVIPMKPAPAAATTPAIVADPIPLPSGG